jgi:glycosyltransferase involved in cell wall biosynthesis
VHLLINALSARALSGWYVLNGHLQEIATQAAQHHQITLLVDKSQIQHIQIPARIRKQIIPQDLSRWTKRWVWERTQIRHIIQQDQITAVLNFSGTVTGNLPVSEYVVALNPWAMVDQIPKTTIEKLKSYFQRIAYRQAMLTAQQVFFCSEHLRQLYLSNSRGKQTASHSIVHIGLEDNVYAKSEQFAHSIDKIPNLILGVSAWAPWKGADRLVFLLDRVRKQIPQAHLRLVGPWPDAAYRRTVERHIQDLQLADCVQITGGVSRDELLQHYAQAHLFALLSGAESYGIPALEAQAFRTPTLGATGCAMPEISGGAGFFTDVNNLEAASAFVIDFFSHPKRAAHLATAAAQNAQKYHWRNVSKPLLESLQLV